MNAEERIKEKKQIVKIPGIGFGCLVIAFIMAIISFANYNALYDLAGYDGNRWTVMFSWLSILCLVFLIVNSLFMGDKPTWTLVIYSVVEILLISAMLQFLQPCVSEIAFVLGSPDLAMGDNAIRVAISDGAITTAVLYVVTCVLVLIAAFAPAAWTFGKKRRQKKLAKLAAMKEAQAAQANEAVEAGEVENTAEAVEAADEQKEDVQEVEAVDGEEEHE